MNSDQLTREQLEALKEGVRPGRSYLRRLEDRMHEQGFPPDDKLLKLVREAHNAADRLWVRLHYAYCGGAWDGSQRPVPGAATPEPITTTESQL